MRGLVCTAALAALVACGGADGGTGTTAADPLDSISGEELFRRGQVLTRAGDFVRAEHYLAAAIRNGYPEERALPALLRACIEAERLVAALSYAEPFLARHPSQWSLRLLVASIHMGLEHDARALEELERVLRDAPEEPPQAHYFLGVLYRDRLEDPETATEHFQRYVALAPDGPHVEEARAEIPASSLSVPVRVGPDGEPVEPPSEGAEAPEPAPDEPSEGATDDDEEPAP